MDTDTILLGLGVANVVVFIVNLVNQNYSMTVVSLAGVAVCAIGLLA